jgi:tetratricopeptide (TPR) repeat protein
MTYAIIIGVGNYKRGKDWDLPKAGRHAVNFAEWLCSKEVGVPPENIYLFLSKKDIDLYKRELSPYGIDPRQAKSDAFKNFRDDELHLAKGSLLYFFGSGHGVLDGADHQLLFLEDWDRELHHRSIDISHLLRLLKGEPHGGDFQTQIAYLDACSRYAQTIPGFLPGTGIDLSRVGDPVPGVMQASLFAADRGEIARAGQFSDRLLKILKHDLQRHAGWPPDPDRVHKELVSNWNVEGQHPLYVFYKDGHGRESWKQVPSSKGVYAAANLILEPSIHHALELSQGFVGRAGERKSLSEWLWTGSENVRILQGLPGMGTTSLAWVWLHEDVLGVPITGSDKVKTKSTPAVGQQLEGVFWWSFKEDGDLRNCLRQALSYISQKKVDQQASDAELLEQLLKVLSDKKFLFVLDGFDRLLGPKSSQADGDSYTPESLLTARFLYGISSKPMLSRLLIGTYLQPANLTDKALVFTQRLGGLTQEDAIELLKAQGLKATIKELKRLSESCECHPLLLRTASNVWGADSEVLMHTLSVGSVISDKVSEKFGSLYERLSKGEQAFLTRCSFASGSISIDLSSRVSGLPRAKCVEFLKHFRNVGLLIDRGPLGFDAHPLLRMFVQNHEAPAKGRAVHEEFLENLPDPTEGKYPEYSTERETIPAQRIFLHRVGAGQFDGAFALFYKFLDPLYSKLGAYDACIRLLQTLFDTPPTRSHLSNTADQVWALNVLAASYSFSGRPRAAVELWEVLSAQSESPRDQTLASINAGIAQASMGMLSAAEKSFRDALTMAKATGDLHWEQTAKRELSFTIAAQGHWDRALRLVPKPKGAESDAALTYGARARIFLMQHALNKATQSAHLAETCARQFPLVWNQSFWLTCLAAEIAIWDEGTGYQYNELLRLLEDARRAHWLEREATLLLVQARNLSRLAKYAEARELVEESIFLSSRSEFRLRHVDALVVLADIEVALGNPSEVQRLARLILDLSASEDGSAYAPGITRGRLLEKTFGNANPKSQDLGV